MPHTVWLWVMRTESRHVVAMLSDHMLGDIGLTRADVERKLINPFWREWRICSRARYEWVQINETEPQSVPIALLTSDCSADT
jgi:uncharacterized protein YjiS (DUF1127 family)